MKKSTVLRIGFVMGFFTVAMASGAFSSNAMGQTCRDVTDAQIVANIYAEINKDSKLAAQISHINVVSRFKAVKLQGWTESQGNYDKIVNIVLDTDCVRLLNVNAFEPAPPSSDSFTRASNGCGPGTKPCGDICIPEGDSCNISGGGSKQE